MKVSRNRSAVRKSKISKKKKCSGSTPKEGQSEEVQVKTEVEVLSGGAVGVTENEDEDPSLVPPSPG